jgi:hypothetical protein
MNTIIAEYLPPGYPLGESPAAISEAAMHCFKVVKSDYEKAVTMVFDKTFAPIVEVGCIADAVDEDISVVGGESVSEEMGLSHGGGEVAADDEHNADTDDDEVMKEINATLSDEDLEELIELGMGIATVEEILMVSDESV